VPESELNTTEGVASCDKCQLRLGRSGNTVTILAEIDDDDLRPELTAQSLRDEMDRGLVVSRLRDKGGKAFADPTVCETIRRTKGYTIMLEVVARFAKPLEIKRKQMIADALQGAYLWDKATLPEGQKIGDWRTPSELRTAVRWAKGQHPKFVRRSRRFVTALKDYREVVRQFNAVIDRPYTILAAMSNLERAILSRMIGHPNLQDTSLKDFRKSPPHVVAAIQIVSILRASTAIPRLQTTRNGAIDLCVAMLHGAGVVSEKQDPDATSKLWESVSKAIQRGTRKQSH